MGRLGNRGLWALGDTVNAMCRAQLKEGHAAPTTWNAGQPRDGSRSSTDVRTRSSGFFGLDFASFYGCPTVPGAYRRRMRDNERHRVLCAGCGDVIGEYEPVWIENEDGAWQPSSLLRLGAVARGSTRAMRHASCAVNDAPPGRLSD